MDQKTYDAILAASKEKKPQVKDAGEAPSNKSLGKRKSK